MSKMGDLVLEIQERLTDGESVYAIAESLKVPVDMVADVDADMVSYDEYVAENYEYEPTEYDEWMDFDPDC